jgi:hypothetical protein
MNPQRNIIGLSIAATLLACVASAHAGVSSREAVLTVASCAGASVSGETSVRDGAAQTQLDDAVRCLKQATFQWGFASNADVVASLRKAQDHLIVAATQLRGARRIQIDQVLADVGRAIERASTQAPNRNQLAAFAGEGQDLARGVPIANRQLVAMDVGSTDPSGLPAHRQIQQTDFALASSDSPSWPYEPQARWPQAHFKF